MTMFDLTRFIIRTVTEKIRDSRQAAPDIPMHIDPSSKGIQTWPDALKVSTSIDGSNNELACMALDEPHTLIAGTTGSGKSVLVHSIIYETLTRHPYEAKLILIDIKKVELYQYKDLPFRVLRYADNAADASSAIAFADRIIRHRIERMQAAGLKKYAGDHVYVIVDELADLLSTCGKEAIDALTSIGRLGRCANVHFIAATQAPDRKTCPASLAQNATLRIGLRCQTAIESRQIINQAGAELLPRYGTALVLKDGYVNRKSVDLVQDADISDRIDLWKNRTTYVDGTTGKVILDGTGNVC